MTYQAIRDAQRAGRLRDYTLQQLLAMSSDCALWLQSGNRDDSFVKDSVDDEIRRKEAKEASDNLLHQTQNLTEQTNKLVGQVVELVGIAAEQKRLAAKLDGQTDTLISLTRWLRGLTIALVVLAIPLFLEALHFVKVSKDSTQIAPYMQQTNQNTQQKTNH